MRDGGGSVAVCTTSISRLPHLSPKPLGVAAPLTGRALAALAMQIITLRDLYAREAQDELYIVMDFMDTDLHRVIQSDQELTEQHFKHFMYQLLRGIGYMQASNVLHRDLKPGNLLVTRHCDLVVRFAAWVGRTRRPTHLHLPRTLRLPPPDL